MQLNIWVQFLSVNYVGVHNFVEANYKDARNFTGAKLLSQMYIKKNLSKYM